MKVSLRGRGPIHWQPASDLQQKTERPVQIEITEAAHLGTRQHARIVDGWVDEIGLDSAGYGTHSMRRTKPTLICRRTRNLLAVQLLLGHTKLESTVRHLGIEVEDALEMAEQTDA